ncbi:AraC family transcriptional regulator [Diaphorobacter sp.]|uniref:helix-turn-helix transcriptional regulator n=1 Tax=Diaphorobacter sp. TaxID=1934310 RepID=UPI002590D273|nr:AraC family transcriptional regulator [Diaphorobacter sp.]
MQAAQPGAMEPRFTDGCCIDRLPLDDGLTLVRSFCCPSRDLAEKTDQSDGRPTLVITFGLSGESAYVERAGTRLRFRQGHTTLSVFASCQGERQFAAGTPVRQLRLSVGETALRRYLGAPGVLLPHRMGVRALGERVTSPWCLPLVRSLASPGSISHLDAHIAALSLVGEHLRGLGPLAGSTPPSARWTPGDVEKLRQARDLMYSQMDRALTIPYLCISVGINEFKLKRGFREIYGTTPYQALLEIRMQRARQLLEAGSQVAQVAYAVGYAHPANFSTAFERYFGFRPKFLRVRRKK